MIDRSDEGRNKKRNKCERLIAKTRQVMIDRSDEGRNKKRNKCERLIAKTRQE
jgi:hypothetical protein